MAAQRYFDDFKVGDRFESEVKVISADEIVEFATRFDPQPFHTDSEAARQTIFGGLIASGFHTIAFGFRLMGDTGIFANCSMGSPGMDEIRWLRPTRPGDALRTVTEIIGLRPSRSKLERGICHAKCTVRNQCDEIVMTMKLIVMLSRANPQEH